MLERSAEIRWTYIFVIVGSCPSPDPCQNGGQCSPTPADSLPYTCNCADGYTGLHCEKGIYYIIYRVKARHPRRTSRSQTLKEVFFCRKPFLGTVLSLCQHTKVLDHCAVVALKMF